MKPSLFYLLPSLGFRRAIHMLRPLVVDDSKTFLIVADDFDAIDFFKEAVAEYLGRMGKEKSRPKIDFFID